VTTGLSEKRMKVRIKQERKNVTSDIHKEGEAEISLP
jgi:hypothetical protein